MKVGGEIGKVTNMEIWVTPGEHQTLDDILQKFAGRVLTVDEALGRVLIFKETNGEPSH